VAATPLQSRLLLSCAPCQIFNTWFILHLFRSPWHMEIKCLRFLWQQVGVDVPKSRRQRSSGFHGAPNKMATNLENCPPERSPKTPHFHIQLYSPTQSMRQKYFTIAEMQSEIRNRNRESSQMPTKSRSIIFCYFVGLQHCVSALH